MIDRLSKTSFEKNCFSAWASTLNMGLINKGWYGMLDSDQGLTLEPSAKHHIPQATNIWLIEFVVQLSSIIHANKRK